MSKFLLYWPEGGEGPEDAVTRTALDAEDAATEWAEAHDARGDYDIVRGYSATVMVAAEGTDDWRPFRVHGESVAVYRAEEA